MATTSILNKPLTGHMIEALMDCHERELMKLEPWNAGTLQHARGLINRGMLRTGNYISNTGKRFVALYVTDLGRAYLNEL